MEVASLGAHQLAELGWQREPAGGGERLADLADRELLEGPLVDLLGAGPQGETQHHVGQVDGLAPGAGVDLGEEHVDQVQLAVADQQVGRLDVAVGEVRIPEPADDAQPLVDDGVVDLGLADLSAPSMNSKTIRYSRSGVSSATPYGSGLGRPARPSAPARSLPAGQAA